MVDERREDFVSESKNYAKPRRKKAFFENFPEILSKRMRKGSSGLKYRVTVGAYCEITGRGECEDFRVVVPKYIDGKTVFAIGQYAFMGCADLISIQAPEAVNSIGMLAFSRCVNLESAVFRKGLSSIGQHAFSGCKNLRRVSLPSSLLSIGHSAFYDCTSLREIRFGGTKEEWLRLEKGINWNANISKYKVICSNGAIKI
jgi:hypothetical protein